MLDVRRAAPSTPVACQSAAPPTSRPDRAAASESGYPDAVTVLTLDAPTRPPPSGRRSRRLVAGGSPKRRLVAVGLTAVLVHVAIVTTALAGLRRVSLVLDDASRITTALRYFQDADMAHDAMRASARGNVLRMPGTASVSRQPNEHERALTEDLTDFQDDLRRVDAVELPPELDRLVRGVRPDQLKYVNDARALLDAVRRTPGDAQAALAVVEQDFDKLVDEQEAVAQAMSGEASRRQRVARSDERSTEVRLVASAVVALLGLLGLTALLHRMGRNLAELLARERGVAETLQHSLLPDRLVELPGLRFAARYVAGGVGTQVGGDWYDVIPLPGGKVGLVMGDVVGHDLQAAASMGQLRNALRACAAEGAPPDVVLERLNRLSVTQELGDMATVLYAVLDPVSGVIAIASAGHYPPLLVTPDSRRFLESAPCPPLGAVREARYSSASHELPAGSLLVLYTDGLVERREATVDEGLDRLQRLVVAPTDGDLERLCDDLLSGMRAGAPPDDDVALLVVAPQAVLGPRVDVTWPAKAERLSLLRHLLERWLNEAGATEDEVYDILVACSEAATNAVEHAYGPGEAEIRVVCELHDGVVTVVVRDWGQWREARGQDRGRGLGLMEELMDQAQVLHGDSGTEVRLTRRLERSQAPSPVAGRASEPVAT